MLKDAAMSRIGRVLINVSELRRAPVGSLSREFVIGSNYGSSGVLMKHSMAGRG